MYRWVPLRERSRSLSLVYSGMFLGSMVGLTLSPQVRGGQSYFRAIIPSSLTAWRFVDCGHMFWGKVDVPTQNWVLRAYDFCSF